MYIYKKLSTGKNSCITLTKTVGKAVWVLHQRSLEALTQGTLWQLGSRAAEFLREILVQQANCPTPSEYSRALNFPSVKCKDSWLTHTSPWALVRGFRGNLPSISIHLFTGSSVLGALCVMGQVLALSKVFSSLWIQSSSNDKVFSSSWNSCVLIPILAELRTASSFFFALRTAGECFL